MPSPGVRIYKNCMDQPFLAFVWAHWTFGLISRLHQEPILNNVFNSQWEAGIWSCDLRANERPWKKLHPMAQTSGHGDSMTNSAHGPSGAELVKTECNAYGRYYTQQCNILIWLHKAILTPLYLLIWAFHLLF